MVEEERRMRRGGEESRTSASRGTPGVVPETVRNARIW